MDTNGQETWLNDFKCCVAREQPALPMAYRSWGKDAGKQWSGEMHGHSELHL